jgi:hypothetical protein
MPCLAVLVAFFFPRVVIALLVLFSDYIGRAYQNDLWALLGFFFMPYTTLAYAWAINSHGSVQGFPLVVVIVAVLCDLGTHGGGGRATQTVVVKRRSR